MSSTVPEQPASGRFQPGELVNVHITGARYEGVGLIGEHAVRVDGDLFDLPLTAVIERVAPKEWPPQPGDIWTDRNQNEWAAMIWDRDVRLYQVDNDGSTREWPETVANTVGPMRLVRRRGWTPDAPPAEPVPAEVDKRAKRVATLRALADFVEHRIDLPVPNDMVSAQASQYGGFEKQVAAVEAAAVALGVEVRRYMHDGRERAVAEYRDPTDFKYVVYASLDTPPDAEPDPGEVGGETVEDAEDQS